jgi:transcription antitermination factor NusG
MEDRGFGVLMNCLLDQTPDHAFPAAAHSSSCWYAVYTYSRHEKAVKACLDAKAMEVFLPTVTVQSRWKDRNMQVDLPAFPGYVFVRISLGERGKVLSAPGVVRILSFNGVPAPIHHAEIDALRLCLEKCGPILEPHPFLEVGERVRVRAGSLQGLEGWITRKKGACRLVLSIALIHQSVAVEVDASLLEILHPMPRAGESNAEASTNFGSRPRFSLQPAKNVHRSSLSLRLSSDSGLSEWLS